MNFNIISRLDDLTEKRGYKSLSELAKKMGYKDSYLYSTFTVSNNAKYKVIERVEEFLKVKKGYLCVHYTRGELEKMSLERLREYAKRYERGDV